MNGANIHLIPNDARDWVVKEEGTERELGHYPTQRTLRRLAWRSRGREKAK